MRICCISKTTIAHGVGGTNTHLDCVIRGLHLRGHEIMVIATACPGMDSVVHAPEAEYHYLPETKPGAYSRSWWEKSVEAFQTLNRQRRFDVVLSQSLSGSRLLSRHPELPHLPILHGMTLEQIINEFRDVATLREMVRYPTIVGPELLFYSLVHELPIIRRAKLMGMTSIRARDQLLRWYGVPESRVRYLPYTVDTLRFAADPAQRSTMRARLKIVADAPVFLMASVATRQKGMHVGIEAFKECHKRYPDTRLVIAGDGPDRAYLDALTRELSLTDAVVSLGSVAHDRMPEVYRVADVFIFPTLRIESTGIVLLEAMAASLAVISSDMGEPPYVLGDTGIMVPPGKPQPLAEVMCGLIENPGEIRRRGNRARERVLEKYEENKILDELEGAALEVMGSV